jgi:hypothetical protein
MHLDKEIQRRRIRDSGRDEMVKKDKEETEKCGETNGHRNRVVNNRETKQFGIYRYT